MKSRLASVVLCVIAFILSLVLMLHLIELSGHTPPDVGDGTKTDPTQVTDPVSDSTPEDVSVLVTSEDGVLALAKESRDFITRLATGTDKNYTTALPKLIQKWQNAADYLSENKNPAGAEVYRTLAEVFDTISSTPFADTADFNARMPGFLNALDTAYAGLTDQNELLFPMLDTGASGDCALACLSVFRQQIVKPGTITVTFTGEISMGDYLNKNDYYDKYAETGVNPLGGVSPVLLTDDISFAALDAPLTTSTEPTVAASAAFRGKKVDTYATYLKEAGFDVISLSGCHLRDFGDAGYEDTKTALEKAGLTVAENGKIAYFDAAAGKTAILSYNLIGQGDVRYTEVPKAQIAEARENGAKLVIVYFHTSSVSGDNQASAAMANTLRDAADNGADLVLCSHSPEWLGILEQEHDGVRTPLLLSPGPLSYGADLNAGTTRAYLVSQTFTMADSPAAPGTLRIFPIDNHSVGADKTCAPELFLDSETAQELANELYAALPEYAGRLTEGALNFVQITK